ncbi:hypothetical protein J4573_38665 [Actinomadura barringtoniae]|uniref:Uncharacterized protein n=1 Tax=Actinomadura barringtoniae TaxID=1427535 RepID=A0A939T8F3_9ACTN|nr:hypothetical protein [Actinomadura barringtoniae]MBO2453069.1 hypothetical protein [Actinomadura barringtoniae]
MAHDAVVVAELSTIPAEVLAAKTYDLMTHLRAFVETRTYLTEAITTNLAAVPLLDRARTVAKARRTEHTTALARQDPLIRDLCLSPVVRLIDWLWDDLAYDLDRLLKEAALDEVKKAEEPAATSQHRRPESPTPSEDDPFSPTSYAQFKEVIARALKAQEAIDTALDKTIAAEHSARRETFETLEQKIAALLDDGEIMDRAIEEQNERAKDLLTSLNDLREQATAIATSLTERIGSGLVIPCAEHDHFVTGRGLDQALSTTLKTFPSHGDETGFIWGFAEALQRGVPKHPAPIPADLGERLASFVHSLSSCQGRWSRSAVGALHGPSPRVAALCLAAEAEETDRALAADLRSLAVRD